jgi:peptidoglycan/LPS O-acetylase OafA/YrhL
MSSINVVAWSLEIEFQFYALAPAIASVFLIRSKTWRRIVLALGIATFAILSLAVGTSSPRFLLSLPHFAQFFLTGFLLCDIYLVDWRSTPQRLSLTWDAVSVVAWAAIPAVLFFGEAGMFFVPAIALAAYVAAFKGTWSNRFFRHPLIYTIGGMCYTIYLYHVHIMGVFSRAFAHVPQLQTWPLWLTIIVTALVEIPAVLLICAGFFLAVEKPCMKKGWYRPIIARLKPSPAVTGVSFAPPPD